MTARLDCTRWQVASLASSSWFRADEGSRTVRQTFGRILGFLAMSAAAAAASAQTAPPTLEGVDPMGAARGTHATLVIQGTNIAGATRLIFSEPGFSTSITGIKEIPIEKTPMPKGVVRTDAPIEDK